MTVRVRSVPPCVSSQTGSRHLPLKQGSVSSSLTWRTNFYSGCGVTFASESWELVVTVRLCPPRPFRIVGPVGSRHGVANAETPVRLRYDAPVRQWHTAFAQKSFQLAAASPPYLVAACARDVAGLRHPILASECRLRRPM